MSNEGCIDSVRVHSMAWFPLIIPAVNLIDITRTSRICSPITWCSQQQQQMIKTAMEFIHYDYQLANRTKKKWKKPNENVFMALQCRSITQAYSHFLPLSSSNILIHYSFGHWGFVSVFCVSAHYHVHMRCINVHLFSLRLRCGCLSRQFWQIGLASIAWRVAGGGMETGRLGGEWHIIFNYWIEHNAATDACNANALPHAHPNIHTHTSICIDKNRICAGKCNNYISILKNPNSTGAQLHTQL